MQPFVDDLFGRVAGGLGDAGYYGDKVTSIADLGFLIERFPAAAFVQLVRDPRDVIASTFAFQKKQAMLWDSASFTTRVEHMARFLAESDRLLQGQRHHFLRYEDLVAEPADHAAALFQFLELEADGGVEDYLQRAAGELFASHGTSSSPAASVGRWRRDLSKEQQQQANEGLAAALERLGYER